MSDSDLIMTLGKVIIATAWVDGKVTNDEINSLKDVTFRLPNLTAHQWAELEMYIETPVDEAERERLVADLQRVVSSPADKALVEQALNNMVAADGTVTGQEKAVVAEIMGSIQNGGGSGFFGGLSNLMDGMFHKRSESLKDAPNREDHFEDYITNKVYYNVRRRLDLGKANLDVSDEELRKLCLAGGIMAQIAHESDDVTDDEFAVLVDALQSKWNINKEAATFVTEVAISGSTASFDHLRLAREFVKVYSHDECLQFLDILFTIATADGQASADEIDQIRTIARAFLLSNNEFIQAKLKVPRDLRQQ